MKFSQLWKVIHSALFFFVAYFCFSLPAHSLPHEPWRALMMLKGSLSASTTDVKGSLVCLNKTWGPHDQIGVWWPGMRTRWLCTLLSLFISLIWEKLLEIFNKPLHIVNKTKIRSPQNKVHNQTFSTCSILWYYISEIRHYNKSWCVSDMVTTKSRVEKSQKSGS